MRGAVSIAAIVVTYGERRGFLSTLLRHLAALSVRPDTIVLVGNAVPYEPRELAAACPGIELLVHRNAANLGSAGGIAQGLASAHARTRADYFWLLDDDLAPEPDALHALHRALERIAHDPSACLLSLRTDRHEYVQAACGARTLAMRPDSFFGFDLGRRGATRVEAAPLHEPTPGALREIGYAPWGGLLMHRSWHTRIAPPRTDYFVYGDDHEYTLRILSNGGRILLCPDSRVRDQEPSWDRVPRRARHFLLDDAASDQRVYLTLRNRVAMERAHLVASRWRYWLNAGALAAGALAHSRAMWTRPAALARRLGLLTRAVRDGWTGRLGDPAAGISSPAPPVHPAHSERD